MKMVRNIFEAESEDSMTPPSSSGLFKRSTSCGGGGGGGIGTGGRSSSTKRMMAYTSPFSRKPRLFHRSKSVPLPPLPVDAIDEEDRRDDMNETNYRRPNAVQSTARDPPSISTPSSPRSFASPSLLGRNRFIGDTVVVDNGTPSKSMLYDLQRVLKLIQDERYLVANDLYVDVRRRIVIADSNSSSSASTEHLHQEARRFWKDNLVEFDALEVR